MQVQPQWQKAQIVQRPTVFVHLYQKYIYVRVGRPGQSKGGRVYPQGPKATPRPCYQTHLESWSGKHMLYPHYCIELCPEFAYDEVPQIPFAVWSAVTWKGMEHDV